MLNLPVSFFTPRSQVTDGQQFTVQAPGGKFDATSSVFFGDGQSLEFHTSCSVPLRVGDIYGPLTVLGGGSCPVVITTPVPVTIPTTPNPCGDYGCCANSFMKCLDLACTNCLVPKVCYNGVEQCPRCPTDFSGTQGAQMVARGGTCTLATRTWAAAMCDGGCFCVC